MWLTLALASSPALGSKAQPDALLSLHPAIVLVMPADSGQRERAVEMYGPFLGHAGRPLQLLQEGPLPGQREGTWELALGSFRSFGPHRVSLSQLRLPAQDPSVLSESVISMIAWMLVRAEGEKTVVAEPCGQGCTQALIGQKDHPSQGMVLLEEGDTLRVIFAESAVDLNATWLRSLTQAPPVVPWSLTLELLLRDDTQHGVYVLADRLFEARVLGAALQADRRYAISPYSDQDSLALDLMDSQLDTIACHFPHDLELYGYSLRMGPDGLQFAGDLTELGLQLRDSATPQRMPRVKQPGPFYIEFVGDSATALRSGAQAPELLTTLLEQRNLQSDGCGEDRLFELLRPWALLGELGRPQGIDPKPVDGLEALSVSIGHGSPGPEILAGYLLFSDPAQASAAKELPRLEGLQVSPSAEGEALWLAPGSGDARPWGRARRVTPGLTVHLSVETQQGLPELFFPQVEDLTLQSQVLGGLLLFQERGASSSGLSLPPSRPTVFDPEVQTCQLELASALRLYEIPTGPPHAPISSGDPALARLSILTEARPILRRCEGFAENDPVLALELRILYGVIAEDALGRGDLSQARSAAQRACGSGTLLYCDWRGLTEPPEQLPPGERL